MNTDSLSEEILQAEVFNLYVRVNCSPKHKFHNLIIQFNNCSLEVTDNWLEVIIYHQICARDLYMSFPEAYDLMSSPSPKSLENGI